MAKSHDTTELLHQLLARLDRDDATDDLGSPQLGAVVRTLATVVDSLDQRLKSLEEDRGNSTRS